MTWSPKRSGASARNGQAPVRHAKAPGPVRDRSRRSRRTFSGLGALELKGAGVDTEALTGRPGTVVEDVPEVGSAAPATDLGPSHQQLPVADQFHRFGHGRLNERTDLGQMFETAATVMGRRGREWTEGHADAYLELYEHTAAERMQSLREGEQRRLRRVV